VPSVLTRPAGDLTVITESVHFGTAEPTSSASVAPFRHAPLWGLYLPHFTAIRHAPVTRAPVSQSPNPPRKAGGIESKEVLQPPALSVASRALLEA